MMIWNGMMQKEKIWKNMNKSKLKHPRWIQWLYAITHGYFWRPCPNCGQMRGGHEPSGNMYMGWGAGLMVCADCKEEVEAKNDYSDLDMAFNPVTNSMEYKHKKPKSYDYTPSNPTTETISMSSIPKSKL